MFIITSFLILSKPCLGFLISTAKQCSLESVHTEIPNPIPSHPLIAQEQETASAVRKSYGQKFRRSESQRYCLHLWCRFFPNLTIIPRSKRVSQIFPKLILDFSVFFRRIWNSDHLSAGTSYDHPAGQASVSALSEFHLRNLSRRLTKVQLEAVGAAGGYFLPVCVSLQLWRATQFF